MTAWLWFLVVAVGAALLGYFIYFGERQTEKETPYDRMRGDEAARKNFRDAEQRRD